jgi:hypothetical protein
MNLTLRDATAFTANLSPVAPPLALSSRQRRDDVEGRPLVSDASEFTRLRVGSPPKRTHGQILGVQDGAKVAASAGRGTWRDGSASRRERGRGGARDDEGPWRKMPRLPRRAVELRGASGLPYYTHAGTQACPKLSTLLKRIASALACGRRGCKSHMRLDPLLHFREKCIGSADPRRSSLRCVTQP